MDKSDRKELLWAYFKMFIFSTITWILLFFMIYSSIKPGEEKNISTKIFIFGWVITTIIIIFDIIRLYFGKKTNNNE
jgi:heme/copper-type cytochrome/quinol oxidase subunit 2